MDGFAAIIQIEMDFFLVLHVVHSPIAKMTQKVGNDALVNHHEIGISPLKLLEDGLGMLFGCCVGAVFVDILRFGRTEHRLCSFVVFPTTFAVLVIVTEMRKRWTDIIMTVFPLFTDKLKRHLR